MAFLDNKISKFDESAANSIFIKISQRTEFLPQARTHDQTFPVTPSTRNASRTKKFDQTLDFFFASVENFFYYAHCRDVERHCVPNSSGSIPHYSPRKTETIWEKMILERSFCLLKKNYFQIYSHSS